MILNGMSEEQIQEILNKRLFAKSLVDNELLEEPEAQACFEDGDQNILKESLAAAKVETKTRTSFAEQVQTYRKKAATAAGTSRKGRPKKVKPTQWPASGISLDFARALFPPSCDKHLQKDTYNNRWVTFFKAGPAADKMCISRSWPLYGEKGLLLQCSKQAWEWHARVFNEPCPHEGTYCGAAGPRWPGGLRQPLWPAARGKAKAKSPMHAPVIADVLTKQAAETELA